MSELYNQAELIIRDLGTEELESLSRKIVNRLELLRDNDRIESIITNVKVDGYYCSPDDYDIPEIKKMKLSFRIKVYAYDKEDKSDAKANCAHDQQQPWVDRLSFEYDANEDDIDNMYIRDNEWDWDSWEAPARAVGSFPIFVYYKFPDKLNSTFDIIDGDGDVYKGRIEDDMVTISNNDKFAFSDWKIALEEYIVLNEDEDSDD